MPVRFFSLTGRSVVLQVSDRRFLAPTDPDAARPAKPD